MKTLTALLGLIFITITGFAQVTFETNDPNLNLTLGFLGWDQSGNDDLNLLQNNTLRTRYTSITWPGYNNEPSVSNASRMFFGLNGNYQTPFSMLHLGENTPLALQGDWMNVGTTYGANADFLHFGLLQSPTSNSNTSVTDAVIAWGCNDNVYYPANGPDNFRFLFIAPTGQSSPGSAEQGLETMRITPWGHVGIGSQFNNALQPERRLTVRQRTDSAQFRIAWTGDANPVLGRHADFQVPFTGNLHIKPRYDGANRTVAISFLQGEATDPINQGNIETALDVGGITRIRKIPNDHTPDCLVAGFNVGSNVKDNFLIRIDMPQDPDLVLNGVGDWIPAGGGGSDFDWETDGTDV